MTKAQVMTVVVRAVESLGVTVDAADLCFTGSIAVYVDCRDVGRFEGWSFKVTSSGSVLGELEPLEIEGYRVAIRTLIIDSHMKDAFGVRC